MQSSVTHAFSGLIFRAVYPQNSRRLNLFSAAYTCILFPPLCSVSFLLGNVIYCEAIRIFDCSALALERSSVGVQGSGV